MEWNIKKGSALTLKLESGVKLPSRATLTIALHLLSRCMNIPGNAFEGTVTIRNGGKRRISVTKYIIAQGKSDRLKVHISVIWNSKLESLGTVIVTLESECGLSSEQLEESIQLFHGWCLCESLNWVIILVVAFQYIFSIILLKLQMILISISLSPSLLHEIIISRQATVVFLKTLLNLKA